MFRKSVLIVEVLALIAAAGFVIALFTNGSGVSVASSGYGSKGGAPRSGAQIYQASCAVCHGDDGQGGQGPKLAEGAVVEAYPDEADQIAVVTNGKGGVMPAFSRTLSTQEIQAVVDYTRKDLG